FRHHLKDVLAQNAFNIVHIDSLDLAAYIPDLPPRIPVVCAHHNVESSLLSRRALAESSPFRRRYLQLQSRLMEDEEREWCPKLELNTVVSESDDKILRSIVGGIHTLIVPNGVDTGV